MLFYHKDVWNTLSKKYISKKIENAKIWQKNPENTEKTDFFFQNPLHKTKLNQKTNPKSAKPKPFSKKPSGNPTSEGVWYSNHHKFTTEAKSIILRKPLEVNYINTQLSVQNLVNPSSFRNPSLLSQQDRFTTCFKTWGTNHLILIWIDIVECLFLNSIFFWPPDPLCHVSPQKS